MNGIVGIVCDDFKLSKFKEELEKVSLFYTVHRFTAGTSTIKITTYDQEAVKRIAESVEEHFRKIKAKNN